MALDDIDKFSIIAILLLCLSVTLLSSFYLDIFQQAVVAYGSLIFSCFLIRIRQSHQFLRVLILSMGLFLTLRYWIFRTFHTLGYTGIFDSISMLLLYIAETYAIAIYILGIFVNINPLKRVPPELPEDKKLLPTVDIFIPTYNEPLEIIKTTVIACKQMKYPKEKLNIFILDDGGTLEKRNNPEPEKRAKAWQRYETLKKFAEELEINYVTRQKNEHAKAGNLNNALWLTSEGYNEEQLKGSEWYCYENLPKKGGDLIVVLDCDHVPTTDFLEKTVGFFLKDEKLFLVQTPHFFINPLPIEKNLGTYDEAPWENEMFYSEIHRGLDFWNSAFFCGSGAVLRRKYLEEAGGFSGKTITEDAETSLTLHSKGYRSAYLKKPMICGLSPETFDDFITQRSRWTQGMIQILMLKNPFKQKGLKWYQRLCYINNCLFWFFGVARAIFILAPLFYLLFSFRVYNVSIEQIFSYALPHLICAFNISNYLYGKVRHPFFSEVFETVQSFFLLFPTIGAILNPKAPTFKVTPKGVSLKESVVNMRVILFYVLFVLSLIGIYAGLNKWLYSPLERGAVVVCMSWTIFNLVLIIASIGALYELRQRRRYHRMSTEEEALIIVPGKFQSFKSKVKDISLGGLALEMEKSNFMPFVNQTLEILTWNSFGDEFRFLLVVKRLSINDNSLSLGCIFHESVDENSIVKYVYGDSGRWEIFWQRRQRQKGIVVGFTYLLLTGFKAMGRNMKGLAEFIVSKIKKYENLDELWRGYSISK